MEAPTHKLETDRSGPPEKSATTHDIPQRFSQIQIFHPNRRRGRFSEVRAAMHKKEKKLYALKVVDNNTLLEEEEALEALDMEVKILRMLNHPHVVSVKEIVTTPTNTYIVMELLSGGELFSRIVEKGSFSEEEAAGLFCQVLLALEYLHSLDVVHRDIKPENILYNAKGGNDIKLIDFGYAGIWSSDSELSGLCGTPDYVAPEVLSWYEDDERGETYGKASDMWSLGVLMYVLLSGCTPFSHDDEAEQLELVAKAEYEFHDAEWADISEDAKDLIRNLLVVDPDERFTMEQVLEHPFLKGTLEQTRIDTQKRREMQASRTKTSKSARSAPVDEVRGPSRWNRSTIHSGDTSSACSCVIL